MDVSRLLDELHRQVPLGAAFGTRWKISAAVSPPAEVQHVAVAARIDAQGRRREQFWCDGVRVERAVWLRLTCTEAECPHAQQVRVQWAAFRRGHPAACAPARPPSRPLMAEVEVRVGRQHFSARPARFPCFTPCPNGAHPPMTLDKAGFDLFDDGGCLGGGVTESGGVRRPRLPTVQAAEAYVLARQLEAVAVVGSARDASRGRGAGPVADAG